MAAKTLLKCGYLLKRQRGRSVKDLRKLKFQQRYIHLDTRTLDYFEGQKGTNLKDSFPVERIRIVENVPEVTFGKAFCFQIGDEKEIMYFRAKSDKDRKEWMEAFRIAISDNEMYDWYHTGAYGQVNNNKWSCCDEKTREAKGCRKTTKFSQRPRLASLSAQWQQPRSHPDGESIPLPPTIAEEFSTSVPIYSSSSQWGEKEVQSSSSQWRDKEAQVEVDYLQEDSEEEQKKKDHFRRSIDSGVLVSETGTRDRAGSYGSVASAHSIASTQGASYSPKTYRRQQSRIQTPLSRTENPFPVKSTWKLLSMVSKSQSRISSVVFRGANTLITTTKGHVHMIDVADSGVCHDLEHWSATAVGTVDVWKKYLVVGFPNIQVVNLDNRKETTTLKNYPTKGANCAQFVSVTPNGQLLSYSKAEPCSVYVWPYAIDSLAKNLSNHEVKADQLIIEGAQEIQSLLVSPDPDQPLMAVVVQLKSALDQRRVRLYNYETKELKHELKFNDAKGKPVTTAFHPYEDCLLIGNGRNLQLYNIKTQSCQVHSVDLKNDAQYITSLCFYPAGSYLTIGLSTGEMRSFEGLLSSLKLVASLNSKCQATSSVAYSKDCQVLAVGHANGTVQLWQVPHLSMLKNNDNNLLLREKELTVTSDGAYFISPDDGYIISVPPGAVRKGETITLKHGVVPHGGFGHFQFKDGMHPVSLIVSVQSQTTKHKFHKPIVIAMPHYINLETADDCSKLAVFKACHTIENGVPTYRFEEQPRENVSHFTVRSKELGTVMPYVAYSTEHCCYWCVGTYSKEYIDNQTMFCLTEARPKSTDESRELAIHYCLSYHLPTCLKAVEEQFQDEEYTLKHLTVVFSDENDPAINIEFEENLSGWTFSLQGGDKIYKKELCFWDYPSPRALVKMCQTKQYPPRFILEANGCRATEAVVARVSFPGTKEFFKRTVPASNVTLKCPPQGIHHNISGRSLASSTSEPLSPWSINHPFQSAMAEFIDVSPVKLAFLLVSKGIIKDDDYEGIKESASRPGSDPEELNMDLLMRVNRIIKESPLKISDVCAALEKLEGKKDIAGKLAKDSELYKRIRMSRSGSAESTSSIGAGSYASAQERIPDTLTGAVAIEAESSPGHDHHGLEQAQIEHNSTELSSPSHTGSSYGNWMPAVSCIQNGNLLQPFYSQGEILSADELANSRQN